MLANFTRQGPPLRCDIRRVSGRAYHRPVTVFSGSYAQLLKSHGTMVIIIPQFTALNAMISKAASPTVTPPFHVSLFRESSLDLILFRVGLFREVQTSQFGPPAFSLLHHYDTSEYWDISIPSVQEPIPRSFMVKNYPNEVADGLSAY